jgi:EAL domain-containing protein (putative c-di-GMP-specific phosphodiesterase class I)
MTALSAPYTLLRRDGETRVSRGAPPRASIDLLPGLTAAVPDRRAGLPRPAVARLIAERRFAMAFQPVVRLADRWVVSHEALLRLRPMPGMAPPPTRAFVEITQAWGLGPALDEAVLDMALATRPPEVACISVNIGARSLRDPVFVGHLLTRVRGEGDGLAIEVSGITGSADLPPVAAIVPALRAAGVRVVLDDFAASEAMLICMQATRFDEVKFAGAVLGDAVAGPRGRKLLAALLALAEAAGARAVAKQVETEAQADLLRALGVRYGQGWLFGAPAVTARDRRHATA